MERAVALHKAGRVDEAETLYRAVLSHHPLEPNALHFLGLACTQKGRPEEAARLFGQLVKLSPRHTTALFNYARVLQDLGRLDEALAIYDRCLAIKGDWPEALVNRGNVLGKLRRLKEAVGSYDRALELRPNYEVALDNRGTMLRQLSRLDEAAETYRRLLSLSPDWPYAAGWRLHLQLLTCDWTDHDKQVGDIEAGLQRGLRRAEPWPFLGWSRSVALQQKCASLYTADRCPAAANARWTVPRYEHDRIRVAYLSDAFREGVESQTTIQLMEHRDRARFETFGLSISADDGSETRARMIAAYDHFVDVRDMPDGAVVQWLREHEIDILVAVTGLMGEWRPRILAGRGVPVQVNFAYPSTMGTPAVDYIIADPFGVPAALDAFYTEKVVRVPMPMMSFYAPERPVDSAPPRRAVGLPDEGFVFCAINAPYKFNPELFDIWARLLRDVEGSVLWLRAHNPTAATNLMREAEKHGLSPERLVLARPLPFDEHLARYAAADLFLDSFPYNAHTTACEALWAGLPIVTCSGETMVSRAAGGLLTALGLGELVTHMPADYEALARRLATSPAELAAIRSRLTDAGRHRALFSPQRYCRYLEVAFETMHARHRQGLLPESFDVPAA
jgi:predicted O-linked N-acetylglucosamine transferase (SPINDLY family)